LSKPNNGEKISLGTVSYFRARNRNRVHDLVLEAFEESGITQAEIARRLGKRPDVICRLIGAPGNWTLDTVSDLLLAIGGYEVAYAPANPFDEAPQNFTQPEWLSVDTALLTGQRQPTTSSSSSSMTLQSKSFEPA